MGIMEPTRESRGRRHEEKEDMLVQDPFLNDYLKITQSGAFRRLSSKAQVLSMPDNPHVRTRLVHTEEVIGISMAIAQALGLNMHLCMAIAAGHDIGHTPYGHLGEDVLTKRCGRQFSHKTNSVVIAQHIERRGQGLNLTHEVLDGMLNHSLDCREENRKRAPEIAVVMYADKIAYTFSDLNDALRYGYLDETEVPECALRLGRDQRQRMFNVTQALIEESKSKDMVSFSEGEVFRDFIGLRSYLFEHFYRHVDLSLQEHFLHSIYDFFESSPDFKDIDPAIATSLLTDNEVDTFVRLLTHSVRPTMHDFCHFGLIEIVPYLRGRKIDFTDPDLDW